MRSWRPGYPGYYGTNASRWAGALPPDTIPLRAIPRQVEQVTALRSISTFDDVMLDWAVAELLSPTWTSAWQGPACDALRTKVWHGGISSLTPYERSWLIGAIAQIRSPIINTYGPCRSWTFWRATVPRDDLLQFSIIHHFQRPTFSFGDLTAEVEAGAPERKDMGRSVTEIAAKLSAGEVLFGSPIAVMRHAPMPPLLIEGYKRSMAALRAGWAEIDLFLSIPGEIAG